jgi:hypothetical protein
MKQERETLQANISDWMVFLLGWAIVLFQGYKYFFGKFEGADWYLEIGAFLIGILFIWKPQTLVNLVSKVAKRKSEGI